MDIEIGAIDPDLVREDVAAIYANLDAAIAALGPRCELSGRCCRFEEYGHTLFLSAVEFAVLDADAPPPSRPVDDGATCPWQDDRGRCTARQARPLGCRVYFCEPGFEDHAAELSESHLARLKQLADRLGLPWDYAPLHRHLRAAAPARSETSSRNDPTNPRPVGPALGT